MIIESYNRGDYVVVWINNSISAIFNKEDGTWRKRTNFDVLGLNFELVTLLYGVV